MDEEERLSFEGDKEAFRKVLPGGDREFELRVKKEEFSRRRFDRTVDRAFKDMKPFLSTNKHKLLERKRKIRKQLS